MTAARMELDHIAVAGESLAAATTYVEEALGVTMAQGGQHDVFHTHNRLLGLESGLYLEAIAVNPEAPTPDRPRWFDLDRFSGTPRLTNWICRTDNIEGLLREVDVDAGAAVALRRGDLRWRMAVPQSGRLPFDNLFPALIQWDTARHPAGMLETSKIRLRRLTIQHPQADVLAALLEPHFDDDQVAFEMGAPALSAAFTTPQGERLL
ncbi:MAG: VOC family protein [Pseudomonadota bacterium]